MFSQKFIFKYWDKLLLGLLVTSATIIYTFVGFNKHLHFQTFAWDTSVFIQQLYYIKDLRAPFSILHQMNGLADHFQVTFLIIGFFFYKIYSDPVMLFFMQGLIGSLSAVPLYLLSKKILSETKISQFNLTFISLSLIFAYLFSVSFQGMMTDEFHNEPLLAFFLLWMLYFLFKKNNIGYWISFVFVILTKEIYGLLMIPFGIYIFLKTKRIKLALVTALLGGFTSVFLLFYLMPLIGGTSGYMHFAEGNSPQSLINHFISNPQNLILDFFNHHSKQETIIVTFLAFALLPIFSVVDLLMPLASLAIRFYDQTTPRLYQFNNHYAAPLIPFMAVATIFGIRNLIELSSRYKLKLNVLFIPLFIIFYSLFTDLYFHGPLNSLLKSSFYRTQQWEKDDYALIDQIPDNSVLAANNSLLPHLSQRDNFYLLPNTGNAEYIAIDLADGPNKYAPIDFKQTKNLINQLVLEKKYQVIWQQNQALLLQKIN